MRRQVFLITAILFLVSSTELHELVRLPRLVVHYIHHHSEDGSLSLAGFLQLHYRSDHPDDQDDNEDRQLPFKSGPDILTTDLTAVVPLPAYPRHSSPVVTSKTGYCPEGIPLHRAYSVFRPPRLG